MIVYCKHSNTNLTATIDNNDNDLHFEGDTILVDALKQFCDSFSFYLHKDIQRAMLQYGSLLIRKGNVYTLDTKCDTFITHVLIQDLTKLGYTFVIKQDTTEPALFVSNGNTQNFNFNTLYSTALFGDDKQAIQNVNTNVANFFYIEETQNV